MFEKGDVECVEKLISPCKEIIKNGISMEYENFEKRIQLWNEIKENFDRYKNGECGTFLEDLDMHYRSLFDISLLILARSFRVNNEDFSFNTLYSDKEIQAYELIESYNVFEISSKNDIKKKVIARDERLMELLEKYYLEAERKIEEAIENPEIRLPIRYYLKKKWDNYKKKMNEAVSELVMDLDWFQKVVTQWRREAEARAEKMVERAKNEIEERKKNLSEKEKEIEKILQEIKNIKDKVEKGSRFVEIREAKFYENNFIGRLKKKLSKEIELAGKRFIVENVKEFSGVDITQYIHLSEYERDNTPENKYMVAKLVEKKLIGVGKTLIFKAIFYARVDQLIQQGIDTDPLTLSEINHYISEAFDMKGDSILLCIASPTGFAREVEEHVCGEEYHKNFLSKVSLCLVDLESGEVIINPHDKNALRFRKLCEMEMDNEKLARVKKCINQLLLEKGYVTLEDGMKVCGEKKMVKRAFYNLEREKGYRVKYLKKIGLVLVRG